MYTHIRRKHYSFILSFGFERIISVFTERIFLIFGVLSRRSNFRVYGIKYFTGYKGF